MNLPGTGLPDLARGLDVAVLDPGGKGPTSGSGGAVASGAQETVWEGAAHFPREGEFSQASRLYPHQQDFSPLLWEEPLALVAL